MQNIFRLSSFCARYPMTICTHNTFVFLGLCYSGKSHRTPQQKSNRNEKSVGYRNKFIYLQYWQFYLKFNNKNLISFLMIECLLSNGTFAFVLQTPLRLNTVGLNAILNQSLPMNEHTWLCVSPTSRWIWPKPFAQSACAWPESTIDNIFVRLLWPEGRFSSQNLRLIFVGQCGKVIFVHLLPANVRWTPIVAGSDPGSKAAIKVESIIVGHDDFIATFQQIGNLWIGTSRPDLKMNINSNQLAIMNKRCILSIES